MKVELRIDPGCGGVSVVINAPALTDEVKALAARLEGGGVLIGWQGGRAVPLAAEDILRCYGEEKGVKCQTPGAVYDLKERLYELEGRLDGIKNYCITVKEHGEDVIFLRKIMRGSADKSFGIAVAHLAGLPKPVLERAKEILATLEEADISKSGIALTGGKAKPAKAEQTLMFVSSNTQDIIQKLKAVDINTLTPISALNILCELREQAKRENE